MSNKNKNPKAKSSAPAKKAAPVAAKRPAAAKGGQKAQQKPADANGAATAAAAAAPKRKLGLRGAAPWAARHAAKHAAEARARAAQPPPPGSARATIRIPSGAEEIKAKIAELHNALVQVRQHRKNINKGFYDVGLVLRDIQQRKLYEAKGYGSFEAFLEREIDLGKTTALKLVRVATTFLKQAALEVGMERVFQAVAALEAGADAQKQPGSNPPPAHHHQQQQKLALPLKPPLSRVGS